MIPCLALSLFASCATTTGGGGAAVKASRGHLEDPRPLVTVGPRCSGGSCTCRQVDDQGNSLAGAEAEAPPAEGMKRFELRTGRGPDDVQITLEGRGTLHKAHEPLEAACGYVDLPPGEHRLRVRVKANPSEGGASPKVLVYEHGERTGSWYGSFGLSCGETGPCTHGELEERIAKLARARGLFDPCGSVKIGGIKWDAEKAADERVTSLDLELVLKVYKFPPRFPRGGACKGPSPE